MKRVFSHLIAAGLVLCGASASNAQTPAQNAPLPFPKTAAEIMEVLGTPPPPELLETFQAQGGPKSARGVVAVAEDKALIAKAPTVGALILFDFNSATIQAESYPLLDEFGKALTMMPPESIMVIAGHTDDKGSDVYNMGLSKKRAEAVRQFLMARYQIAADRLLVHAYGEKMPYLPNSTDENRSLNRRVEFMRLQ